MSGAARRRRGAWFGRRARVLVLVVLVLLSFATALRVIRRQADERGDRQVRRLHEDALVHFEAGRFAESAELYRRLLELRPGDQVARLDLGLALLRLGRDDEGWRAVAAAAAAAPDLDAAHMLLAERALQAGDSTTAVRELGYVVARPPDPPGARARLAQLLLDQGERNAALAHLRRAVDDADDAPAARARAALQLARQYGLRAPFSQSPASERRRETEAYRLALEITDEALRRATPEERPELLALRPLALLARGESPQALAAVDEALAATTDAAARAGLRVLRAQVYAASGAAAQADQELDAAFADAVRPAADAFLAASDLWLARGARDRALSVLARGVAAHPEVLALRLAYARTLQQAGQTDQAEQVLRAGEDVPATVQARALLGDLRRARGDLAGARGAYDLALELAPDRTDLRLRRAAVAAEFALGGPEPSLEAVTELERLADELLARQPDDPEALLARARAVLVRGHSAPAAVAEARPLLRRAIDGDPLLFEAHVVLAYADLQAGAYDEAAAELERIVAALPSDRPRLRLLLAEAYLGLGAGQRALAEARRAAAGLGSDPAPLRAVVRAARLAGETDAALDALRRLEALQPRDVAHVVAQALLLAEEGRAAEAESRFAAAERVAETLADADAQAAALRTVAEARAAAYSRAGENDRARGTLDALVGRLPNDARARLQLGRFQQATGDVAGAERTYQAAILVAPDSLELRRALVDLWVGRGDVTPELVEQVARMRVAGGEGHALVRYAEGKLAALQGDLRLAQERFEACAAELADDADLQFALGSVRARAGDLRGALTALETAARLAPASADVRDLLARTRYALARDLARRGRLREATATLRGAVDLDPDAREPRAALADLLSFTGETELGESEVRAMLRRTPDDLVARRMLAAALARRGAHEDAVRELQRVLDADAADWTAWGALSASELALRRVEAAEKAARRAREAAPDEPASLAPLLHVLVSDGRVPAAVGEIDGAIAAHPRDGLYHLMRAMLHARAGEHEGTVAEAGRALDLAPAMSAAARLGVDALRFGIGDVPRALAFARERLRAAPDEPDLRYLVASLESQSGDGAAALATLEPLVADDVEHPYAPALSLAVLLRVESGATAPARHLAERGLADNPENVNLQFLVAQSHLVDAAALGDPELHGPQRGVVVRALERVLELAPQHHTARNALAYVLSSDEATCAQALELAQRAVEEAPGHAPYADTLALVQLRLGRADDALATLRRALDTITRARDALRREQSELGARADPFQVRLRTGRLDAQEAEIRARLDEALRASRGN